MAGWAELNEFLAAHEVDPLPGPTPAAEALIARFTPESFAQLPEDMAAELSRRFAKAARSAHELRMSFIPGDMPMAGEMGSPKMNETDIRQAMLAAGGVLARRQMIGFAPNVMAEIPCACIPSDHAALAEEEAKR